MKIKRAVVRKSSALNAIVQPIWDHMELAAQRREEREAKRLWSVFRGHYGDPLVPDDWGQIGANLRCAFRAVARDVLRRRRRK